MPKFDLDAMEKRMLEKLQRQGKPPVVSPLAERIRGAVRNRRLPRLGA